MRSLTKSNQEAGRIDWVPCSVRHSRGVRVSLVTLLGSISAGRRKRVTAIAHRGQRHMVLLGSRLTATPVTGPRC